MKRKAKKKYTQRFLRMSKRRIRQCISLALVLGLLGGGGAFLQGRVVQAPDGDTLVVVTSDGMQRIRLYGVDCPELGQPGGKAARDFAASLVFLEPVSVAVMDTDRYGRTVAVLTLADGRVLNEELVRGGHAWVYTAFCKAPYCRAWQTLQQKAKEQRLGLWAQKKPEAPWAWRRQHSR